MAANSNEGKYMPVELLGTLQGILKTYYSGAVKEDRSALETTSKTIVGAINEIHNLLVQSTLIYTVTNTLSGVVNSESAGSVIVGGTYTGTLSLAEGYENLQATIEMGGTDITGTAYDSSTGVISISEVTGNIVITATASLIPTYSITLNLTGVGASNTATSVVQGGSYSNILSVLDGYGPGFHLTIVQGGLTLVDQDFSGSEPITLQSVSGDLVITAVADPSSI